MVKNYDDMLSRFHLIPERCGQTDRRMDRFAISISRVSMLTRDKNYPLAGSNRGWVINRHTPPKLQMRLTGRPLLTLASNISSRNSGDAGCGEMGNLGKLPITGMEDTNANYVADFAVPFTNSEIVRHWPIHEGTF